MLDEHNQSAIKVYASDARLPQVKWNGHTCKIVGKRYGWFNARQPDGIYYDLLLGGVIHYNIHESKIKVIQADVKPPIPKLVKA